MRVSHVDCGQGSCGYGILDKSKWPYWSVGALSTSNIYYGQGPVRGCGCAPEPSLEISSTLAAIVTMTEHLAVELLHAMCLAGFTIELPAVVACMDSSSVCPCILYVVKQLSSYRSTQ